MDSQTECIHSLCANLVKNNRLLWLKDVQLFAHTYLQNKHWHSSLHANVRKSFTLYFLHINTIHHAGSSNYISKPIMTQITHSPASQFVRLRNVRVNHQCAAVECGKRASSKIRELGTLYSQDRLPGAIKCLCLKEGMAERDMQLHWLHSNVFHNQPSNDLENGFDIGY